MMIEFKYENQPDETFYSGQTEPNKFFYFLKKEIFPRAYFDLAPKGLWYGRNSIFKPKFV
jgi:hypothetical protein